MGRVNQLESRYIPAGGQILHTRVSTMDSAQPQRPLVLVHGLLVSSRYMIPLARRLAPHYPVYAPDLPGYGLSSKPKQALRVPELGDMLAAWMTAAGLERAVLVGNSFGCQIIVDFASRYPEMVDRLVLLGPTVDPGSRGGLRLALNWALLNVPFEPASLVAVVLRDFLDMRPRRLVATLRYMLEDRIETKLAAVRAPTLVARGGRDPIVSGAWIEEVASTVARGSVAVVPGAAHTINYNAPAYTGRLVLAFLTGRGTIPAAPRRSPGQAASGGSRPWSEVGYQAERRRAEVGPAEIFYQVLGSGPPLVLIHGLSGSGRWWARNAPSLANRFRVYVIDLIGFGRSRGGPKFVLSEAAAGLARWMDVLGMERASLVGHSMGGLIAAQLAADFPKRVERLVLVNAVGIPSERSYLGHALGLLRWLHFDRLRFLPILLTDAWRAGPLTILKAARELLASDIRPKLRDIQAPTLLIWGRDDTIVPIENGQRLQEQLRSSELVVLDQAAHNPMWDMPEAFNRAVLDFLGVEGGRGGEPSRGARLDQA